MRKISQMYQWSGGTDYRHTCYECKNCVKVRRGNRTVYKCMVYGNTDSEASDWKQSYIACKHFDKPPGGVPIVKMCEKKKQVNADIEGQMNISDFLSG